MLEMYRKDEDESTGHFKLKEPPSLTLCMLPKCHWAFLSHFWNASVTKGICI